MRDLKKDLELCEKATSGAWESSPAGNWYGAEVNSSKVVKMWLELKEALASLDGDNA